MSAAMVQARAGKRRRWLTIVVGLVSSCVFGWLTLRGVELPELLAAMQRCSLPILACLLLTRLLSFSLMALRSRTSLAEIAPLSLPLHGLSHLLAFTGNNLLPFRMGEVMRIEFIARRSGATRDSVFATVATEKLLDMLVLLVLFAVTVPLAWAELPLSAGLVMLGGTILAASATAVLIARNPERFSEFCRWILRPLPAPPRRWAVARTEGVAKGLSALASMRGLAVLLLTTALYWGVGALGIYVWIASFGLELPWYSPFWVLSVTAFGTVLPASPGFVGTYHFFVAFAFERLGLTATEAASIALVGHAASFVPFTVIGTVVLPAFFARRSRHPS